MTRRTERINDLLREEISDLVLHELKDPRIGGLVSITEVDVSPDLRHAKVFVSVLGSNEERSSTLDALEAGRRFLQRELRRRVTMRYVPDLAFLPDDSMERGQRILSLIDHERDDANN
jgi:ribosome-binding factor A